MVSVELARGGGGIDGNELIFGAYLPSL